MTKFVIWGAGKLGKRFFELVKKEKVIVIVDRDVNGEECFYKNVPIISPETFYQKYAAYPVVITPKGYEEEIENDLKEHGVVLSFHFFSDIVSIAGFTVQAPVEALISGYKKNDKIIVYGLNILGLLMYDFFRLRGYQCKLCVQNSEKGLKEEYLKKILNIELYCLKEEIVDVDRILLATELEPQDEMMLRDSKDKVEKYYDIGLRKELYHNRKIEKFKNRHKNERCFIVATGPSLKISDLDKLYENHEISISVNGIFKAFDMTPWRPDYYTISDTYGVIQWKQEIINLEIKEIFIADMAWIFDSDEIKENMYKWHFQYEWKEGVAPDFSDDFSRYSYFGTTITYEGALQLAAYMGFSEIYLIGVDCCLYGSKEKQHFVEEYDDKETKKVDLPVDNNILAYQAAKKYADEHGIKIYNATRGGKLEVFERVDFDSLFEEK